MSLPPPSTPPQAPVAEHTAKFNFGWQQPPLTTVAVATHVGFDHNNKSFQFSSTVPQAALVLMAILAPTIATMPEAAPAPESDPYMPKALLNWEGGFPAAKRRKLDPTSQVTHQDTIGHLIRDAEKAAIDIVKWLNGDESSLGPAMMSEIPCRKMSWTATTLYYWCSLSFMDSLANEVETAERTTSTLEASGTVVLLLVHFAGVSLMA
ncbi:hypothetical protein EV424DRAFT_1346357 [Suillus variegatus]|nr:hypothetical protein EV424DRAFT_1346357 [Suillus variegatus]